ncbi:MAG: glutathione S-transferase N-terminal domain-containing protein [Polyangiaceae bacterium]
MGRALDVATAWTGSVFRLGAGLFAMHAGPRPEQPVVIYEFEGCPFCRKVREALTMLDLDAEIRPCPQKGPRFREEVIERWGKSQFPVMIDPNTGDEMYESADIVRHLYRYYGDREAPVWAHSNLTLVGGGLASMVRVGHGSAYRPARRPEQPLELYSFEASPFCRLAREALCELELPYLLHNVGKRSPNRRAFIERSGKMMVPYLVDPNTDTEMFESADIVRYLNETYAL